MHEDVDEFVDGFELIDGKFEFSIDSEELKYEDEIHSQFRIFSDHVFEYLKGLTFLAIRFDELLYQLDLSACLISVFRVYFIGIDHFLYFSLHLFVFLNRNLITE